MVAAAIVGGAVISGVASFAGASQQAGAAEDAANRTAESSAQQLQYQREQRARSDQILSPYSLEGGVARRLHNAGVLGIPTAAPAVPGGQAVLGSAADTAAARAQYNQQFEESPYWQDAQYATGQGVNALMSTSSAMGRGGYGGKEQRGASDIAKGYRGQARDQFNNALLGVANTGYSADTGRVSEGRAFANNAANILANSTNAQNQYYVAGANAMAGGWHNLGITASNAAGQFANMPRAPTVQPSGVVADSGYGASNPLVIPPPSI